MKWLMLLLLVVSLLFLPMGEVRAYGYYDDTDSQVGAAIGTVIGSSMAGKADARYVDVNIAPRVCWDTAKAAFAERQLPNFTVDDRSAMLKKMVADNPSVNFAAMSAKDAVDFELEYAKRNYDAILSIQPSACTRQQRVILAAVAFELLDTATGEKVFLRKELRAAAESGFARYNPQHTMQRIVTKFVKNLASKINKHSD